jgi:protein TonB
MTPPPNAMRTEIVARRGISRTSLGASVSSGMLVKKVNPEYPPEAKKHRIQGVVVLEATVGTDGKIHDLRVISAPSSALADSSFSAVSQWEYRAYLVNGEPVPVSTTIRVTFALGR